MSESLTESDALQLKRPSVWFSLAALIAALIAANLCALLAYDLQNTKHSTKAAFSMPVLVGDQLGLWIVFALAVLYGSKRYGSGSIVRDFGLKIGPIRDILVGGAIGVASQILLIPALYFPFTYNNPSLERSLSRPAQRIVGAGHGFSLVIVGLFLVVGAPFMEELFFRGLLLNTFKAKLRFKRAWVGDCLSVLASSVLFALAHFEPLQFFGLVFLGVILGLLALKSRRLGPSMAVHASFNAVSFVLLLSSNH